LSIRAFKIGGKMIRFLSGSKHQTRLLRVGLINKTAYSSYKYNPAFKGLSFGAAKDLTTKTVMASRAPLDLTLGVTTLGKRRREIFISLPAHKMTRSNLRKTVAHELFHTKPIIGRSEIGAHFWGGLHSQKNKLSFKEGISEIRRLAEQRPLRFSHEVSAVKKASVAAVVVGGVGVAARERVKFIRRNGRIIPIRSKNEIHS